jgi:tRNA threonylcarbamoyladenosine dehydratase
MRWTAHLGTGQSVGHERDRIAQINPECRVHVVDDFVTPENWQELMTGASIDVLCAKLAAPSAAVIDACDHVKAKVAMADWAIRQKAFMVITGSSRG